MTYRDLLLTSRSLAVLIAGLEALLALVLCSPHYSSQLVAPVGVATERFVLEDGDDVCSSGGELGK